MQLKRIPLEKSSPIYQTLLKVTELNFVKDLINTFSDFPIFCYYEGLMLVEKGFYFDLSNKVLKAINDGDINTLKNDNTINLKELTFVRDSIFYKVYDPYLKSSYFISYYQFQRYFEAYYMRHLKKDKYLRKGFEKVKVVSVDKSIELFGRNVLRKAMLNKKFKLIDIEYKTPRRILHQGIQDKYYIMVLEVTEADGFDISNNSNRLVKFVADDISIHDDSLFKDVLYKRMVEKGSEVIIKNSKKINIPKNFKTEVLEVSNKKLSVEILVNDHKNQRKWIGLRKVKPLKKVPVLIKEDRELLNLYKKKREKNEVSS
jgi:hypothetical protein